MEHQYARHGYFEKRLRFDYEGKNYIVFEKRIRQVLSFCFQSKARHHAISSKFVRPFSFQAKKPLIVQ